MSEGVAWNQGELSEETRAMVLHQRAIMNLMDEILAVSTNPHASLNTHHANRQSQCDYRRKKPSTNFGGRRNQGVPKHRN